MEENNKIKKTIALVSFDPIGDKMAGVAIRYLELAKILSKNYQVILFATQGSTLKSSDFQVVVFNPKRQTSDIGHRLSNVQYLVAQNLAPELLRILQKRNIRFIADLYDPILTETLEYEKDNWPAKMKRILNYHRSALILQLTFANHLLYANRRQQDLYAGVMSATGILDGKFAVDGFNLDNFMTEAPFGVADEKAKLDDKNRLFSKFPKIKPTDTIVVWGGGIWNWFDPISLIKALAILKNKHPEIKLLFYGVGHPNPKIKKMKMAAEAIDLAKKNGTFDENVFFNTDWVDYQKRVDFLLPAKIGVSTHFNNVETHFSFRTRILDYLWTELPMVLTRGDFFAELCQKENLGIVVDFQSPNEIAEAIKKLATDGKLRDTIRENIRKVRERFFWSEIGKKIAAIIENDHFINRQVSTGRYFQLKFGFYYHWLKKKI